MLSQSEGIEDLKGLFENLRVAFGGDKLASIVETSFSFYLECLSSLQKECKERLFYLELEAWMETLGRLGELVLEDHNGQEASHCLLEERLNSNILLEPDIKQSKYLFKQRLSDSNSTVEAQRGFGKSSRQAPELVDSDFGKYETVCQL